MTDATHAALTYTALTSGAFTYKLGDPGANVNATTWTITGLPTAPPASALSDDGSANQDGFGIFNQTTKGQEGFASSVFSDSFVLTNTSGTWANAAAVLTPSAQGWLAVAHLFVCSTSACTLAG